MRLLARLENIPLLARAGSILPVDLGEGAGYQPGLEITPDSSGHARGQWYTDAGDGPPDAAWRLDDFSLEEIGRAHV